MPSQIWEREREDKGSVSMSVDMGVGVGVGVVVSVRRNVLMPLRRRGFLAKRT